MIKIRYSGFIALCLLMLSGCVSLHENQVDKGDVDWALKGRVSVKIDSKAGSADFSWDKYSRFQKIELSGPLGIGRVVISSDMAGAQMVSKNDTAYSNNINTLLFEQLHWPVPFDDMNDWLQSWLNDTDDQSSMAENWQIDIKSYATYKDRLVPKKIFFKARPVFIGAFSDAVLSAYKEGRISKPDVELPPKNIELKVIIKSYE